MQLYGGFRGGWWSLENARMELHLLEADDVHDPFFDPSHRGGFALFGRWQGQELVLDRPVSVEFVGNTAYIVSVTGDVYRVKGL